MGCQKAKGVRNWDVKVYAYGIGKFIGVHIWDGKVYVYGMPEGQRCKDLG